MGIAELEQIGEILASMGDVTVEALVWFMGFSLLKYIIGAGVILTLAWAVYRIILATWEPDVKIRALRDSMGVGSAGSMMRSEYTEMSNWVGEAYQWKAKADDYKSRLKAQYEQHDKIQADFDTLAQACETYRAVIQEQKDHIAAIDERAIDDIKVGAVTSNIEEEASE